MSKCYPPFNLFDNTLPVARIKRNIARLRKAALRTSQVELRCQVVLNKILFFLSQFELSFVTVFKFYPNLSFWTVTISVFEFSHNSCLRFFFLSQPVFWVITILLLSLVTIIFFLVFTISVFEICNNLCFWVVLI